MTRIACAQIAPSLGDVEANLKLSADAIADAVAAAADIVVLPELVTSGYMFADTGEARAAALTAEPSSFARWVSAAGNATVIGGFCELGEEGLVYNSAVVIDAGAVVAIYRKTHLWDGEKLIFARGDRLPPVVATRHGAIAVTICYDLEFPEVTRKLALAGAELIAAPVNWPLLPHPDDERPGEVITAMSTARINRVAVAICDRTGAERGQQWAQATTIIDADGWVVTTVGPGVGMTIADIDLAASRDKKLTAQVDVLADRRVDLY